MCRLGSVSGEWWIDLGVERAANIQISVLFTLLKLVPASEGSSRGDVGVNILPSPWSPYVLKMQWSDSISVPVGSI